MAYISKTLYRYVRENHKHRTIEFQELWFSSRRLHRLKRVSFIKVNNQLWFPFKRMNSNSNNVAFIRNNEKSLVRKMRKHYMRNEQSENSYFNYNINIAYSWQEDYYFHQSPSLRDVYIFLKFNLMSSFQNGKVPWYLFLLHHFEISGTEAPCTDFRCKSFKGIYLAKKKMKGQFWSIFGSVKFFNFFLCKSTFLISLKF